MRTCGDYREPISALVDGEQSAVPTADIAAHLAECADCSAWHQAAVRLRREVPTLVAPTDMTAQVLTAFHADEQARRAIAERGGMRMVLRWAVAAAAAAQILLALPFLGPTAHEAPMGTDATRIGWEMAAFQIAFAVALIGVALRPATARTMLTPSLVLAGVLLASGIRDVVAEPTSFAHHIGHVMMLVPALTVWGLTRFEPRVARAKPLPRVLRGFVR